MPSCLRRGTGEDRNPRRWGMIRHVTPMLYSLHWQPVEQRTEYKLSLLCCTCWSGHFLIKPPSTVENVFTFTLDPSWQFRSSADTRVFRIPAFRSFSYEALPVSVRDSASVSSFKSFLKTFLFSKNFSLGLYALYLENMYI